MAGSELECRSLTPKPVFFPLYHCVLRVVLQVFFSPRFHRKPIFFIFMLKNRSVSNNRNKDEDRHTLFKHSNTLLK